MRKNSTSVKSAQGGTTKSIQIACKGSRMAQLSDLEIIQGDLKELSKENYLKLRKRIETKGFDAPVFVWGNKILDGTQRVRVLHAMIADGWRLVDDEIPICDIEAKDLNEAKDRLLGYVSQYGKVTEDGLYEFLSGIEAPDLTTIDLPNFDFGSFQKGFLEDQEPGAIAAGEEGKEELVPYERVHILLSFNPDLMPQIQGILDQILSIQGVEYEQGQN